MAKRKERVTKDELRGLCEARRQAIEILEEHRRKPRSSDALAKKMAKNVTDFANEIADTLEVFLGLIEKERPSKQTTTQT